MVPPHFQWMFLQETPAGCGVQQPGKTSTSFFAEGQDLYGGFLSHEGTPSSHPFIVGVSTINNPVFLGHPHDYGNLHMIAI